MYICVESNTKGFPILGRWHIYIESRPWCSTVSVRLYIAQIQNQNMDEILTQCSVLIEITNIINHQSLYNDYITYTFSVTDTPQDVNTPTMGVYHSSI